MKLGLETCCSFTAGKLQLYEMHYNHKEDVTVTERPSEQNVKSTLPPEDLESFGIRAAASSCAPSTRTCKEH